MKFKKITLDESLFDDSLISESETSVNWTPAEDVYDETDNTVSRISYDDDFSAPDYMPPIDDPTTVPSGPREGSDTGVADTIISAIKDEFETIRKYNSLVATLRHESVNNPVYESFVSVINEITNEENKHVGQLQELLKQISPNAESIDFGQQEGESQLRFTNGLLQVQSWDTPTNNNNNTANQIDDVCMLSDVDDDM